MAGIKVRRTLDDRGFKKYMAFCESLKDGSNDALIDTFKYRFAVMEGRIVPKRKKKAMTEAAGISLGDFETAFKGLVGAFLPHMDEEDQEILGNVCTVLDEKINSGDMAGAMDSLKSAVRSAGGDPDAYEDDGEDDDTCPECGKPGDERECDDGCPEGECRVDGECVPCDETDGDDGDKDKEKKDKVKPNSADAEEECCGTENMTEAALGRSMVENLKWLKKHNAEENELHAEHPNYNDDAVYRGTDTFSDPEAAEGACGYGFGYDPGTDDELDFEHSDVASPSARYDAGIDGEPSEVDYDAMADELLDDAGFGSLTRRNGGVTGPNRQFVR